MRARFTPVSGPAAFAAVFLAVSGCESDSQLTAAPEPGDNPASAAKVALGRDLFWDPILSGDEDTACATCHHPKFGYADGRSLSIGTGGLGLGPQRVLLPGFAQPTRNAMTVLDTAWNGYTEDGEVAPADAPMFWDNRTQSLEGQAGGPMTAPAEMMGTNFTEHTLFPEIVARLLDIPEYADSFDAAFGAEGTSEDTIRMAIAAYERSLSSRDSSYDRYVAGDTSALTAQQRRGLQVFRDSHCDNCHSGPMFSDFELHDLGVPNLPDGSDAADSGERFRTASLRRVTLTAPYMHNGVFASLEDVYDFYRDRDRRSRDEQLRGVRAPGGRDAEDVTAFLRALSDAPMDDTVPAEVPSGLSPGGEIE